MKALRIVIIFLVVTSSYSPLQSQIFFTLTETTQTEKVFVIEQTFKDNKIKRYPNVDINSRIDIKLNKEKIKDEAAKYIGTPLELPFVRMKVISEILVKRNVLIEKIKLDDKTDLAVRKKALSYVAENAYQLLIYTYELPPENSFRIKVNTIFSKPEPDASKIYNEFFIALQEEIDRINTDYAKAIEANKVYFRMGAFLNNVPVHLEGFDVIKEKEYYKVPRFVTSIPDSVKKTFENYKNLAEDANKDAYKAFKNKIKEAFDPLVDKLRDTVQKIISKPISDFTTAISAINSIGEDVKNKAQQIENNVIKVEQSFELFKEILKQTDDPAYFNKVISGLQALTETITQAKATIKNLSDELNSNTQAAVKTAVQNFNSAITTGIQIAENTVTLLKGLLDSKTELNITLTEKIQESLLKLSNDVKKIPLENIPESSTLDLCSTGYRKEGDKLFLKAVLGKQDPGQETSAEKTIEFIPIGLYQIGLHNNINAVLLFVDNTSTEFATKKQFQMAPAYSVLFKKGCRKSSFYNQFIDFGLGVNIATLDFNNDNTPEIGIGLVGSAFKDYLQVGYGRNMSEDKWYWFFGIRLPLLGFNVNGNPKINSDNK